MMLPSPPAVFKGRDKELDVLSAKIPADKVLIIAGIDGSGKTALASYLARKMQQEKQKIIWVSCENGWQSGEMLAALVQQLKDLTLDRKYSALSSAQSEDIIKALDENSLLLFIDDFQFVENSDTLKFIINSCRYLNTARIILITNKRPDLSRSDLAEIFELQLTGLAKNDSLAILKEMLPHDLKLSKLQEDRIFDLTRGYPFLLKMFAVFLKIGEHTVETLLEDCSDFRQEAGEKLLNSIWEKLTEDERSAMLKLSVLRVPVRADLFFSKAEKKHVKCLSDSFLLEISGSGIELQVILKDFALKKIPEAESGKFQLSAAEYFCHPGTEPARQIEAFHHFVKAGCEEKAVDFLLTISDSQLLSGEETEIVLHLLEGLIQRKASWRFDEILRAQAFFLIPLRKFQEAETVIRLMDERSQAFFSSRIKGMQGLYDEAIAGYRKALALGFSGPDLPLLYASLAFCLSSNDVPAETEIYYKKALALEEEKCHDPTPSKARILLAYGVFLDQINRPYEALACMEKAEVMQRKLPAFRDLSNTLYQKAALNSRMDKLEQAEAEIRECEELKLKFRENFYLIYIRSLQAFIHFQREEWEQALELKNQALELSRKLGLTHQETYFFAFFGEIYMRMGDLDKAEMYLRKALESSKARQDELHSAEVGQSMALYLLFRGRTSEALEYLTQARDFALKNGNQKLAASSQFYLSIALELTGDECFSEFRKAAEKLILELSGSDRVKFESDLNWFADHIRQAGSGNYTVITQKDGKKQVSALEIGKISQKSSEFEIFVDFANRILRVDGKDIDFFSKRTLLPLFTAFATQPGKSIGTAELFFINWGRKFDPEYDGISVRKAISRLRAMLDKKNKDRFICSSDQAGYYHFNDRCDYYIILENPDTDIRIT
ncbi:MAG: tetratricopeptide repeat protein [Candidatus Wallbacteria bacterium]|nr:tetratricopeptide repeat protein [Candidatus Wallbacteria bacterium]